MIIDCCAQYGQGNGPVYKIFCPSSATNITQCSILRKFFRHDNDVGVKCGEGQ